MTRRAATAVALAAVVGTAGLLAIGAPNSQAADQPIDRSVTIREGFGAAATGTPSGATAATTASRTASTGARRGRTRTPIKHVVVIFDENISYDHYFGTYPKATNQGGTRFRASKGTPRNDNLVTSRNLRHNPNLYPPFRLGPDQAMTCDQDHGYTAEQQAYNGGAMDQFVQSVSRDTCTAGLYSRPGLTMGYYDGNTVTGLWNYAQHFAMSDSSFSNTFGPSTPGALNLVSGNTHGFYEVDAYTGQQVVPPTGVVQHPDAAGVGTVVNDPQPAFDDCSAANHTGSNHLAAATGRNLGDLLNAKGVTWGWFQGGFAPSVASVNGSYAACGTTHTNLAGATVTDYIPHHNPFSYYRSTANPHHLPPTSIDEVGRGGQANHNYDLSLFAQAVKAKRLPSVSFLKAGAYQDGHAGYSDPIDEQHFLVEQINLIQRSKYWKNTAVVIAYDDSDGWYDHRAARISNGSNDPAIDTPLCSGGAPVAGGYVGRCGPGPRLPLLVISPYARANHVDHHQTDQTSILKFIEDNWRTGRVGDFSFDAAAGSLKHLFDFRHRRTIRLLLKPDGAVKKVRGR